MSSISYVSAPQASIFFGGILIDECYDIQYSYREAKEPIYGYLSRHYDAILDGTVIITGAFTINYKHDQYLSSALGKASNPDGAIKQSTNARPEGLKAYQSTYNTALARYADKMREQTKLKQELSRLGASVDGILLDTAAAKDEYESQLKHYEALVDERNQALSDFEHTFSAEDQGNLIKNYNEYIASLNINKDTEGFWTKLTNSISTWWHDTPDLRKYIQLNADLDEAATKRADLQRQNLPSSDVSEATTKIEKIKEQLKAIDLDALRNNINTIQNNINNLTVTDVDLMPSIDKTASLNSVRAEDYGVEDFGNTLGFVIEIDYNGSPHKRILNCQLLGHAHVITQSGMPVKEQYTFIGQRFE
jgi:hypothetical protein